jgi:hypothetical protein
MAGIIRPSANSVPGPSPGAGDACAACEPVVATVSVDVAVLFVTEIGPSEQVAAGRMTGETLQVRVTVDGSIPPNGLIVIVDFADAPGVTDDGKSAAADRLKSGLITTWLNTGEVLMLKLLFPP